MHFKPTLSSNTRHLITQEDGYVEYIASFYQDSGLFNRLYQRIDWQQDYIQLFGKAHAIPRLQCWYGEPHCIYRYSNIELRPKPFTSLLQTIRDDIEHRVNQPFNCLLANLYRDGNDSNGWHADDEAVLGKNPAIASLSFGGERKFSLRHNSTKQRIDCYLADGDLLLMLNQTQHYWQHTISKTKRFVEPRINLTFRYIQP